MRQTKTPADLRDEGHSSPTSPSNTDLAIAVEDLNFDERNLSEDEMAKLANEFALNGEIAYQAALEKIVAEKTYAGLISDRNTVNFTVREEEVLAEMADIDGEISAANAGAKVRATLRK